MFAPFSGTAIVNLSGLSYKSGGVGLSPAIFFFMMFIAAQMFRGSAFQPVRISTGHLLQIALIGLFSLTCLVGLLGNGAFRGITPFQITQTVYLFIGIICTCTMSFEFARDGALETAIAVLRASAVFVSLWGLMQFFCSLSGLPYPSVVFNNSMSDFADLFDEQIDELSRIASVAVEPSFFAAAMMHFAAFGATVIVYEKRLRTRSWVIPVAIVLLALVLSTSTTAYGGLAVLAILLLVQRPLTTLIAAPPAVIGAIFAVTIIPKLRDSILQMTVQKSTTSSYQERFEDMRQALAAFSKAPIFGTGWASAPNINEITTLLSSFGIVGTCIALAAAGATMLELWLGRARLEYSRDWKLAAYAAGVQNALLVAFATAVSSGQKYVDLDDACYWAVAIALTSRMAIARRAMRSGESGSETALPRSRQPGRDLVQEGAIFGP